MKFKTKLQKFGKNRLMAEVPVAVRDNFKAREEVTIEKLSKQDLKEIKKAKKGKFVTHERLKKELGL